MFNRICSLLKNGLNKVAFTTSYLISVFISTLHKVNLIILGKIFFSWKNQTFNNYFKNKRYQLVLFFKLDIKIIFCKTLIC